MLFALMGVALMTVTDLPVGSAPPPVPFPHFPDRLHAFVWRNWSLVPLERLAQVLGAKPDEVKQIGRAMGLPAPPRLSVSHQRRSALTVIRRNWHLLPYEQLLTLLAMTAEQLAYTLREDDFLYIKLGSLKPRCEPIRYSPPDAMTRQRAAEIAEIVRPFFARRAGERREPLFHFVEELSRPLPPETSVQPAEYRLSPRFCYSYFALYGDPLMEKECDPYPDGYLARLARAGVDGVWLQAVLYKLAPFPWNPMLSAEHAKRLANLRKLVTRARRHGIGIYLYLNEPRAMPVSFFTPRPELKGVTEADYATLCTSQPEVRKYLTDAVEGLCRAVPDLAGLFTISASENLTHCWSHGGGASCPRCSHRSAGEVIAEVNACIQEGIAKAGAKTRLIAWDWGWPDDQVETILRALPRETALMSVSEWNLPIRRGGVESVVGEYSISAVGPGPRAKRHWGLAQRLGKKTFAKIQAGITWELSAVPYIPALENVAQHAVALQERGLEGLMLGWTLGGYPSPNLQVVAEVVKKQSEPPADAVGSALHTVAAGQYGLERAPKVVQAWREFSAAFREFPFHIGLVYTGPMQVGPANLLWAEPTNYRATMVGFPYDDLDTWREVYPPEIFIQQFDRIADGFHKGLDTLSEAARIPVTVGASGKEEALRAERSVAEAAAIHFRSVANQARFILARRSLAGAVTTEGKREPRAILTQALRDEITLATRLYTLQSSDSRIGFEASNQYYYVPLDLIEKVLNCRHLLEKALQSQAIR